MTGMLFICGLWAFDRIEPPFAVVNGCGRTLDVAISQLPLGARPGDLMLSPLGPVLDGRAQREADLRAELEALLPPPQMSGLASGTPVRHVAPMGRTPDHYSRRAQAEGYRARSVYKLDEIDKKVRLLRRGQRVLDLGCAPGSWTQFAAKRVGPTGRVVGIDLQVVEPIPGNVEILRGDAFDVDPAALFEVGGGPFDVVLSDMAPATSGNRFADHARSVELCRRALAVAETVTAPGGAFVCKVFEGEDVNDLVAEIRARFDKLKRVKPKSTRTRSVELFVVAQGFKPLTATE